jgi:hypothetical protein
MTAEDIAKSYVRPRPEPRGRSKLAFWMIFVVVPLTLFGAGEVAGARLSSMPWWIPVSAAILGLIVGLWQNRSGFHLLKWRKSKFRFLIWMVFFLCWRGFTDFLVWCVVPHERYHSLFDLTFLAFFLFGYLGAVLSELIHGVLSEDG